MYKVLILGAGLTAKPIIEYLLEKQIRVTVASPMPDRAESMISGNPLGTVTDWSMDDPETLVRLVSESDLTVSLLPYKFHSDVARICLKNRKSLITTSYVQADMLPLENDAREAGILFLNEMGLDPGIDHMSATKVIDYIHRNGGKVEEFWSLCGALPAPEAAGNPFGYKFTWSPKGVVLASRNGALYLKNGEKVSIEPINLFRDRFTFNMPGLGDLEVYPNRNSISYLEIYGIPEVKTMYRGTFRYKGWCETLDAMKHLNMLDDTVFDYKGKTYSDFLAERAGSGKKNLKKNVAARLGVTEDSAPVKAFEFLGLFSDEPLKYAESTPFDITSDRMIKKMNLADNERDVVMMQHIFLAVYPGNRKEVIKSSMIDYGTPATNTAIARTVALPAAIAARMILEKRISLKGIYRPVVPEIYLPVLGELKELGISMKEEYGLPESEKNF
jgi:saccharopine dehydrogenase (NADP+, L-glutamate forming)